MAEGTIPKEEGEEELIIVSVSIEWDAGLVADDLSID
jgi:formaldehyde-activating enzyme involved in methanogenesis